VCPDKFLHGVDNRVGGHVRSNGRLMFATGTLRTVRLIGATSRRGSTSDHP
jgi:hypothetical protein